MTFIFLLANQITAVDSVQGNLTRVHHRLKRNDNDQARHQRRNNNKHMDENDMTPSDVETKRENDSDRIFMHLQMLDITRKMIVCQETLLIGIDQCRLCLCLPAKWWLSQIISSCRVVSCPFLSILFKIINRLFCVYSTTTKKIALDCSVFSAHFLNGCIWSANTPNAY